MTIDEAWERFQSSCEDMRRRFLDDPICERFPKLKANAHRILQMTEALAYNTVMAPQQNSPIFSRHHYIDQILYTAHQPNPDFCYYLAFLNGARTWRITGDRGSSHWVSIQVMTGWWGEENIRDLGTYDLDEFMPAGGHGSFTIIAGPDVDPDAGIRLDPDCTNMVLQVRCAQYDWDNEIPPTFNIQPLDGKMAYPVEYDEAETVRRIELCGQLVKHAIGRWTTRGSQRLRESAGLNNFVTHKGDPARGGANMLSQYGQCIFDIAEDEALIIETDVPDAAYWGISLGNWWWQTVDAVHHKSSINGHQAVVGQDGRFRAVVALSDPGVPNWLDPAGWNTGVVLLRWYKAELEQSVSARKVPLALVREHFSPETPMVTSEQRQREIDRRRKAIRSWWGY